MTLSRKELAVAALTGASGAAIAVAALLDSWRWAVVFLGALMVLLTALILVWLRRQDASRTADLQRIERKIDNVALRVVTESQATHREISGLIEELGSSLKRD